MESQTAWMHIFTDGIAAGAYHFNLGDFQHDFGIKHKKPAKYLVFLQRNAF